MSMLLFNIWYAIGSLIPSISEREKSVKKEGRERGRKREREGEREKPRERDSSGKGLLDFSLTMGRDCSALS